MINFRSNISILLILTSLIFIILPTTILADQVSVSFPSHHSDPVPSSSSSSTITSNHLIHPRDRRHGYILPSKALIGMVHVRALPGTPAADAPLSAIVDKAVEEADLLLRGGFDAIVLENMHDTPYVLRDVGPEITAAMTAVATAVKSKHPHAVVGIQILAGANKEAMAAALASGADFIRAEGFVFAHVADEGIMDTAAAADLLRYRKMIGAEHIAVFSDIKKKHSSHAITADLSLGDTAKAASFFRSDGLIITGSSTGQPTRPEDVREAQQAVSLPVLVGSGVDPSNLAALWPYADAFIVGSFIKRDGHWNNELDADRIKQIISAAKKLRDSTGK
eukprot:gb/GECH01012608.1/.p1 GENE.gb/GECH01012608.1/~~gb/GECH01012608.1/.p1  ORF type:complete len:336 (+),score=106.94 gb/GECH01012608.1/:1-1008(+)